MRDESVEGVRRLILLTCGPSVVDNWWGVASGVIMEEIAGVFIHNEFGCARQDGTIAEPAWRTTRRTFLSGLAATGIIATASAVADAAGVTRAGAATVQHGRAAQTPRPNADVVTWVGVARPLNARNQDRWVIA